ncbi:MAG: hypothetical protein WBD83_11680, partial [Xanthobacteraceae bacterium]
RDAAEIFLHRRTGKPPPIGIHADLQRRIDQDRFRPIATVWIFATSALLTRRATRKISASLSGSSRHSGNEVIR